MPDYDRPGYYSEPEEGSESGPEEIEDNTPRSAYGTASCAHCGWGIEEDDEDKCPKCAKVIHAGCEHTCPERDGVEWPGGGPLDFAQPRDSGSGQRQLSARDERGRARA